MKVNHLIATTSCPRAVGSLARAREGLKLLLSYHELVRNLVWKDLKLKYRGSILGFLWSLANPLLLIVVYSFVFTRMLRVGTPNFPLFLLVGILPWNFFATALNMSTVSVLDNGHLIRKIWVPIEVFPIATVLFNLTQFALALGVLLPAVLFVFEVSISWALLVLPLILVLHVLFTLGLCFLCSTATVFYRDVKHFTEIFLVLLFWLTPIIYDVETLPEYLREIVFLNPMSFFIACYQDVIYRQVFPDPERLIMLFLITLFSLGLGYLTFASFKLRFPEEV